MSFVQVQSIQSQLDELEEHLVDCQQEQGMGDFFSQTFLNNIYLSNVLWSD